MLFFFKRVGVRTLFFSPLHYLQSSVALLILYYYAKTLTRPDRFMSFFFLKFLLRLFFLPTTRNWDTGGRLSPPNTGRGRGSLRSPASCESMNFAFSIFFLLRSNGATLSGKSGPVVAERPSWSDSGSGTGRGSKPRSAPPCSPPPLRIPGYRCR